MSKELKPTRQFIRMMKRKAAKSAKPIAPEPHMKDALKYAKDKIENPDDTREPTTVLEAWAIDFLKHQMADGALKDDGNMEV